MERGKTDECGTQRTAKKKGKNDSGKQSYIY